MKPGNWKRGSGNRRWPTALSVLALAWLAGACVPSPATDSPGIDVGTIAVVTHTPPSPSESIQEGSGECHNDYFPTDDGSTWEYTSVSNGAGALHRTVTMVSTTEDGFTAAIALASGASFVIEWSCSDGDLTQLTPTASLSFSGGSATVTATNHSGVTLPADLEARPTWREAGEWSAGSGGETIEGGYTSDNTAVGTEVVTVPFGTFEAMRVEAKTESVLNGEPTPPCQITQWWARDVGLIKQKTACTMGGQELTEVVELTEFSSPN